MRIPFWKPVPFLRLLLALITGILLQWYAQLPLLWIGVPGTIFLSFFFGFRFLPVATRFRSRFVQGLSLQLVIVATGALLAFRADVRNRPGWFGKVIQPGDQLLVQLAEPLTEKPRSWKATVLVKAVLRPGRVVPVQGKLLIYFAKTPGAQQLTYGDELIAGKAPGRIKNPGNPGAFDYAQYAAFQGIFHSGYFKETEWIKTGDNKGAAFNNFLIASREKILAALRKQLTNRDELGIAEALLIGYNNDLDRDLLQAYSNTGVVHVIAISGMHLALIYLLLQWIFRRLPFIRSNKLVQLVFVLALLWLFALLTGGSASVLRAAVMFSFISIGAQLSRKASIYNSLAASAFVLLCYNPYYLWDVGFQLSYAAVLGIVVFQKPLYHLFFIKNKLLDQCWKLASVSLAAQVFTFPACIYYFHQFPNLFLLANLLVVPLSGLLLYAAIALVAFSFIPGLAFVLGKLVSGMLWLMNQVVFAINKLPLAVWDHIHLSFLPALLLYVIVAAAGGWLLHKNKMLLYTALSGLCVFMLLQAVEKWTTANRQQVIVYNIPGTLAIDVVSGNRYSFIGDSGAAAGPNQHFHLKPARIALQLAEKNELADKLQHTGPFYAIGNKKILLVDKAFSFETPVKKTSLDLILLSKNAPVRIAALDSIFECREYIFDASSSTWRIGNWVQECKQLNKNYYSIPGRGAYIAGYNR